MSGVAPRPVKPRKTLQAVASSDWSSGALSAVQLERANSGRQLGDLESWAERREAHARMAEDTRRMADVLEAAGIVARLDEPLTGVGACTGQADTLESWRNINVLPLVASRNRRPVLKALTYFLQRRPPSWGRYRYAVVTSGERVEVFGDLRGRIQGLHRRISKWAAAAGDLFGIEVVHRQTEVTVDEDLSMHPHSNVVYRPTRRLSRAEWARFLMWSGEFLGSWWRDCGVVEDAAEIVKYCLKGDDLALLMDAACLVDRWADGHVDPVDLVDDLAHRIAGKTKREAAACRREASEAGGRLWSQLRAAAAAGKPHPLVWLAQEVHRLHLGQAFGPFRAMLRELRDQKCKVATVWSARGARLQPVRKRERAGREPTVAALGDERAEKLHELLYEPRRRVSSGLAENQLVCIQAPAPRFTPWCEPVAIIANYNPNPRTPAGEANLARLSACTVVAYRAWMDNGAPAPEVARRRAAMVLSAAGVEGGGPLRGSPTSPARPYSPHLYENCPEGREADEPEPPDDGSEVDIRDWVSTGRGLVNIRTGEIIEEQDTRERLRDLLRAVDDAKADAVWADAERQARDWRERHPERWDGGAELEPSDDCPWWNRD